MEIIRRFFNRTAVVAVLAILAVASIIAAVFINIDAAQLQSRTTESTESVSEVPTDVDATMQDSKDYKSEQDNVLNGLLTTLDHLSNPDSNMTDIIDRYIELRYNYTNGPDKEYILGELSGITRKFFLGAVDNSLNYLEGDSQATVIKRYANISLSNDPAAYESIMTNFVYIVNINGECKVMEYTISRESGKNMLYSEREIGLIDSADIETEELHIPNVTEKEAQEVER